jgi:sortase A
VKFGVKATTQRKTNLSPLIPARANAGLRAVGRYFAPLLLFSGIAVLGYVGFEYGAMIYEQRHLQELWGEQQKVSHETVHRSAMEVGGLTRIRIPSIDLSAVIVEGTDVYSLLIGPGHLTGTALPGDPGNAVISAHRDTFFRHIRKLVPGDRILIERGGRTFTYAVEDFRIVKPNDISVAAPTNDNRLTLITCDPAYYPGPAPQRLVVLSKLVSPESASPPSVADSTQPQPRIHVKRAAMEKAARGAAQ